MLHRGLHVWSLKRYAVTVMDNWTPMRLFWTRRGASKFWNKHWRTAHLFWWSGDSWIKLT